MNIEECKKKNGVYTLLECKNRMSEFEFIVKDGKFKFIEVEINPYKRKDVNEKDFDLMCDLHESEDWIEE